MKLGYCSICRCEILEKDRVACLNVYECPRCGHWNSKSALRKKAPSFESRPKDSMVTIEYPNGRIIVNQRYLESLPPKTLSHFMRVALSGVRREVK